MHASSASLTLCRLTACCYIGTLLLAGSAALIGLCTFLFDLALQLSRSSLTTIAF